MSYVKLFINNQEADISLDSDLPVSLVLQNDVAFKLDAIASSFTKKSISLPATKRNNVIFKRVYNYNSNTILVSKPFDCKIEFQGNSVFEGKLILESVILDANSYNRKAKEYRVTLYSNNADWFFQLQDKRFRDFDIATLHYFDEGTITKGINNKQYTDWAYTLVKYRTWLNETKISFEDFTPVFFISDFLENIFKTIGFRLDSDFFSSASIRKLCIPVQLRDYDNDWKILNSDLYAIKQTEQFGQQQPQKIDFDSVDYDGSDSFLTNNSIYICPFNGFYECSCLTFVTVKLDGIAEQSARDWGIVFVNGVQVSGAQFQNNEYIYYDYLQAGDTIEFRFGAGVPLSPTEFFRLDNAIARVNFKSPFYYVNQDPDTLEGFSIINTPVELRYLVPETWKLKDFLLDLTKIFCLVWTTNSNLKIVKVEPRDSYFLDGAKMQGFYIDNNNEFSQRRDFNQEAEITIGNDQKSKLVLNWKSSDETTTALDGNSVVKLFGAAYNFDKDRFDEGVVEITTSFFSKCAMLYDDEIKHPNSEKTPLIPLVFPTDYRFDNYEREYQNNDNAYILVFEGNRNGQDGLITMTDDSALALPFSYFVNYDDADPIGSDVPDRSTKLTSWIRVICQLLLA